ncbi:hypothetical protein ACBR40_04815 [Nonomuraea sp. AD125B]|uniref:hypothetical protein n=1 Tax=Nonomuraea sp. AD125B TaxID=3242897 RepID=UPI0035282CDA
MTAWAPPARPQGDCHPVGLGVLLIAWLAGAESLLCCMAIGSMHTGFRADLDRELPRERIADMVSGALGGLPVPT